MLSLPAPEKELALDQDPSALARDLLGKEGESVEFVLNTPQVFSFQAMRSFPKSTSEGASVQVQASSSAESVLSLAAPLTAEEGQSSAASTDAPAHQRKRPSSSMV